MIGAIVVGGSVLLAAAFAAAWWRTPGLRRAIEAPKHGFAARLRQYDERVAGGNTEKRADDE